MDKAARRAEEWASDHPRDKLIALMVGFAADAVAQAKFEEQERMVKWATDLRDKAVAQVVNEQAEEIARLQSGRAHAQVSEVRWVKRLRAGSDGKLYQTTESSPPMTQDQLAQAVTAERERCAKFIEMADVSDLSADQFQDALSGIAEAPRREPWDGIVSPMADDGEGV